jgi:hypothetical protein
MRRVTIGIRGKGKTGTTRKHGCCRGGVCALRT